MTAPGGPGGRPSLVEASTTVAVAVLLADRRLQQHRDQRQLRRGAANYDGVGDSYSAQALAAGTPTALTPGSKVTIGGTTFTWPDVAAGQPDNVVTAGQTVALSGSGTDLGFLGASQNGTASGTVTVHYTDGSSQSFNLNMADWYANGPAVGNQLLTTTSSWNFQSNPLGAHPVSIYFASVPLSQGKTVSSVTLPILSNAGGTTAMHIFAMATGNRDTDDRSAVLLARRGLRQRRDQRQRQPGRGGLRRHRGQLLRPGAGRWHAERAEPGGQATFGGTTFTWPTAVGARQRDRRRADHRPVRVRDRPRLPGRRGRSARPAGPARSPTPTAAPSRTAWSWPTGTTTPRSAGDEIATTTTSWNFSSSTQTAHPVSIYFASVPLDTGKTVASVTLPTVSSGVGNGINAMHIFAMAIGSGS